MSSVDVFEAAFPTLTALLRRMESRVFHFIFPHDAEEFCPMSTSTIPGTDVVILWPSLAFLCVFGILIGLYGAWRFAGPTNVHKLWSAAYLFFASMNAVGFFAHSYGPARPNAVLFMDGDIVSTSTSSFCLLVLALYRYPFGRWLREVNATLLIIGYIALATTAEVCLCF